MRLVGRLDDGSRLRVWSVAASLLVAAPADALPRFACMGQREATWVHEAFNQLPCLFPFPFSCTLVQFDKMDCYAQ